MKARVLLTGASGFVGRHCLGPLAALGWEVHAVARRPLPGPGEVVWHRADLLDRAERRRLLDEVRPEVLVHAAWYAEHGKYWQAPENELWLAASAELFARAAEHGARRIVGVGSCAEYDWGRGDAVPWKESDACAPATPYGRSKLALQEALERLGVSYAWARLFFLFGAYENPARLVPSIITALLRNEGACCTSGRQVRDFLAVSEAGAILAALAAAELEGAVNVASGEPVSMAALAAEIGDIIGKPELVRLGALPDRADEPPYIVADTARLRGLRYERRPLGRRLAETVRWWREYTAARGE